MLLYLSKQANEAGLCFVHSMRCRPRVGWTLFLVLDRKLNHGTSIEMEELVLGDPSPSAAVARDYYHDLRGVELVISFNTTR